MPPSTSRPWIGPTSCGHQVTSPVRLGDPRAAARRKTIEMKTEFGPVRLSRRDALGAAFAVGAGALGLPLAACGDGERAVPEGSQPTAGITPTPGAASTASSMIAPRGWRKLEGSGTPGARRDHALAVDSVAGRVYVHGGRASGTPKDDLWRFDVALGQWDRLTPSGEAPKARFGHNAAWDAAGKRLLVFGGQAGSTFFNDLWAYDPASNRWSVITQGGPAQRYGAGGAFDPVSGTFYVSHGFTSQGRFDDTWALALADGRWSDISPSQGRPLKRCLLRSVWEPGMKSMLLFGGQSNSAPYHDDFWRLDTTAGAWREVTAEPRPSARNFYAAAYDDSESRLLILGGATASGLSNDVWAFTTAAQTWSRLPADGGPSPRAGHDAVYVRERHSLLLFGGATTAGEQDDVWELGLA